MSVEFSWESSDKKKLSRRIVRRDSTRYGCSEWNLLQVQAHAFCLSNQKKKKCFFVCAFFAHKINNMFLRNSRRSSRVIFFLAPNKKLLYDPQGSENIWFTVSVSLCSAVWCRVPAQGIIIQIHEYKGVITSRQSSVRLSPANMCVYVVELWGCDRGAVTCVHQCRGRARRPIYISRTNGCLIRRGGWVWPFHPYQSRDEDAGLLWSGCDTLTHPDIFM